jgi:hypothetical protein
MQHNVFPASWAIRRIAKQALIKKTPMSQIPEDSQAIRPLLVNATIPQLTLTDTDGQSFNVNAAVHEHPTILLFYRGGW